MHIVEIHGYAWKEIWMGCLTWLTAMKLWLVQRGRRLKVDFSRRQRSFCLHSLAWTSMEEAEKMVSSENTRDNSQEISKHPWTYTGLDTLGYQASTLSERVHVFWDLLKRCQYWDWHDLAKEDHCSPKWKTFAEWFLNHFHGFPLPSLPERVHASR